MPKFILSKSKVLEQYEKAKNYSDIVSYSLKTNPIVGKILEKETDSLFSVHFANELKNLSKESMPRVLFLAQAWNKDLIKKLLDLGIKTFIVDNEPDLNTLIDFLNSNDSPNINLFLRLRLKEYTLKTERYFVFGMSSEVVNKKIIQLKDNPKIKSLGIHFHRKTQNISEWDLKYEISNLISKEALSAISYINIGGGIPGIYANTNENVIKGILEKIKEFKLWINNNGIKMIIEPGRFIAGPSVKLLTKIIGIHKGIYNTDNTLIVDASLYNSDLDALIVPVKLLVQGEKTPDDKEARPYIIKGITPCSMDLFRYRVYLKPPKLGDEIVFLNAGAYNFSSDFCNLDKIPTEIVD